MAAVVGRLSNVCVRSMGTDRVVPFHVQVGTGQCHVCWCALCGLEGNLATVLCICDTVQQVIVTDLLGEKMIFVRRRACLISGAYVQQPAAAVCQRLFLICEEFGPNIGYIEAIKKQNKKNKGKMEISILRLTAFLL